MNEASAGEIPEATEHVPGAGVSASEAQETSRKLKVKIDGIEQDVDIDEITKDYQKYKASDKRFQEAAELRKQATQERELVEQLLGRASKGDLSWLKGLVPKEQLTKWAESELLEHIEWNQKPEVERRAIEAERRAQELEHKIQEYTHTKERDEASALEERAYQQVESDIVSAVKELGYDYKITPRFIRRISEQMLASLEASDDPQGETLNAKTARDRAWKGLLVDAQEVLSTLPVAEALKLLPPKLREAIRRADVDEAMNTHPARAKADYSDDGAPAKRSKFKRMSTENYFQKLEQRFKD